MGIRKDTPIMEFDKPTLKNPDPLYLQIANNVEQKIKDKEIFVGQKLPTLRNLTKTFDVSLLTMRGAISKLVNDGYLARRERHGTFVISSEPKKGIDLKRKNEIAIVLHPVITGDPSEEVFTQPYFQRVVEGMAGVAKEKDMYIVYNIVKDNEDVSFLSEKQKDLAGLIFIDGTTKKNYRIIKNMKIPFVLIGDVYDQKYTEPEVDIICNDDFQGTYLATKHLTDLGHRRIAYITHSLSKYFWEKEKLRGYEEALKEAGIDCDKNLEIETGKFDTDITAAKLKKIIKNPLTFTALISNDIKTSREILKALQETGMRVPEDISIMGVPSCMQTHVAYDWKEMGKVAFERLIQRLTSPDWKPERVVVPYKFNDMGTTKTLNHTTQDK
jgi:DNA-binding LacI/PurR family transcriptional regulator